MPLGNFKGPTSSGLNNHIKLSIGHGRRDEFSSVLNQAIQSKAWEYNFASSGNIAAGLTNKVQYIYIKIWIF